MYIPSIFFGQSNSCIQMELTGSQFPSGSTQDSSTNTNVWNSTNVTFGQISSSVQSYFYIKVPQGKEFTFNLKDGVENAKLLLVGGGGGSFSYQKNPLSSTDSNSGGGASGLVVYQDINLTPGLYYMSASEDDTNLNGGTAFFRKSANGASLTSSYVEISAVGGGSSQLGYGGSNAWFGGGNPIIGSTGAGGGGGGTTSAGTNATVVTNYSIPGSGGNGYTIPTIFTGSVGASVVASGGCGNSYTGQNASQCAGTSANQNWGNGANGAYNDNVGGPSLAMLFIPINYCKLAPSGSVVLPQNETLNVKSSANIQGTFVSGSSTYAYHIFTSDGKFQVVSGTPTEAKILAVGGGAGGRGTVSSVAGGAGAGKVAIKRNVNLYGTYQIDIGTGGTSSTSYNSANNGKDTTIRPISTFITYFGANGGGSGASPFSLTNGTDGGSGGGGSKYSSGGVITLQPGYPIDITSPYNTADELYGNPGGIGFRQASPLIENGGGGGGAGSSGYSGDPNAGNGVGGNGYTLTGEFFPSGVFFGLGQIAKGGSIYGATDNGQPANSGNGGYGSSSGAAGFLCITYKIS